MTEYIYEENRDADGVIGYIKRGELVRCKDCRWHKPNKRPYTCERGLPMCTQYDYCSYGERREP